jgi:hypothetical protein
MFVLFYVLLVRLVAVAFFWFWFSLVDWNGMLLVFYMVVPFNGLVTVIHLLASQRSRAVWKDRSCFMNHRYSGVLSFYCPPRRAYDDAGPIDRIVRWRPVDAGVLFFIPLRKGPLSSSYESLGDG